MSPEPVTEQAARTLRRARFRDTIARPRDTRTDAEHDHAVEAFVEQLHAHRRPPRGTL